MERLPPLLLVLAATVSLLAAADTLDFTAEDLEIDLRTIPGAAPALGHLDCRLTLAAWLPRGASVLRIADPVFAPVTTDHGERLGLTVRPDQRTQLMRGDQRTMRDGMVRVTLELVPPRQRAAALVGITGTLTAVFTHGMAERLTLEAVDGTVATVPDRPDATVTVEDRTARRIVVGFGRGLAGCVDTVHLLDAEGAYLRLLPRPEPSTASGAALRLSFNGDVGSCRRIRVRWYQSIREQVVRVAIPRLELPGGLPGTGDLVLPAPVPAPPASAADAPLVRAVLAGDCTAVSGLVAAGADPAGVLFRDGRSASDLARDLRRWDIVYALWGNPPSVSRP